MLTFFKTKKGKGVVFLIGVMLVLGYFFGDEVLSGTLFSRTITTNEELQNGLVGYWTFDGGDISTTTVFDRSGNMHDGTLAGPVGDTGTTTVVYTSSGTFNVPAGVTSAYIKAWGAGGGGGDIDTAAGGVGGGGGFAAAIVPVTPTESLTVSVGGGGGAPTAGGTNNHAGGGGGYSGVFRSTTPLLMAGGGGGGGGPNNTSVTGGAGGPGGNSTGGNGASGSGASGGDRGDGGTQAAGGAGGSGGGGEDGEAGEIDGRYHGGDGGNTGTAGGGAGGTNNGGAGGGSGTNAGAGGGGGAGYFGGGGGERAGATSAGGGGGGGGSNYVDASGNTGKISTRGSSSTVANAGDSDYAGSVGNGGAAENVGNPGRVVIKYDVNLGKSTPGRLGQALSFDGTDDYISVGNIGSGVRTIAFWMKADDTTSRKIINIDGTDQIELNGSSQVVATSFPGATIYIDGVPGSTVTDGWHHVTITDATGVNASTFEIGRVSSSYFDGTLDDVRTYNRVLSPSEIKRLYELGATTRISMTLTSNPALEDGLTGHWTFDAKHTSASTAFDRSGQGNNATKIATSYIADAVVFDGTNDYLSRGANYTGQTDTQVGTWAFWFRHTGMAAAGRVTSVDQDRQRLTINTTVDPPKIELYVKDAGNNEIGQTSFNLPGINDGGWHFIMVGVNLAKLTMLASLDGTPATVFATPIALVDAEIDWTRGGYVGANASAGNKLRGELADLWFDTNIYLNPHDSGDVAKFYNAGKPVDLGSNGSIPTGTAPILFLHLDDGETANNFAANAGTGNGMTVNGALTTAATSPTDGGDAIISQAPGRLGQAVSLNGSDEALSVGNIGSGVRTIAFWMKADDTTTRKIINIDGTDQIELNAGNQVVATSFPGATVYIDAAPGSTVTDGWHHVTITDATGVNASTFEIGRVSSSYFDGTLDDVRTYNRVLSPSEIKRLYELGATTHIAKTITSNPLLQEGLAGYWSFDGNAMGPNVRDISGQGNHGNLTGQTPTTTTPGRLGQALSFDGTDDYISVGNIGSGVRTIAFWMKADDTTTRKIINIDGTDQIELNAGNQVVATSFPGATVYIDAAPGSTVTDGWHHVTITDATGVNASTFEIGRVSSSYFDGTLDDVRTYNRVLSPSEIKRLYELGSPHDRIAVTGGGPGTLSFVDSANSNTANITIPAGAQEGDIAILFDSPNGSPQPTYARPAGWIELASETDPGIDNTRRTVVSYSILGAGAGGTSVTGMSGSGSARKIMVVFRPTGGISAVTRKDYNAEWTAGNPTPQAVNASSGNTPLLVFAHWRSGSAIAPRTATPAVTEITANNTHFLGYTVFNSSPTNHSFDMDDEGAANFLQSFYLEIS